MTKCTNDNCPIVKLYGQICTSRVPINYENNDYKPIYKAKHIEPVENDEGQYHCWNFGD